MKTLFHPVALSAVLGIGGLVGTDLLLAQEQPVKQSPGRSLPADPPASGLQETPGRSAARATSGTTGNQTGDSKADPNVAPVKVLNAIAKTDYAIKPKDLSPAVKKGLKYLVDNQQKDGGWNQGGGWRTNVVGNGGARVETAEDPSDIGNSCFVLLALNRAGNTTTDGEYKDAVQKGLKFVIERVEKADSSSLYVTDVRGTQLQGKIGQYVDTFLVNLTLAEYRGKAGDQEAKLIAALEKTMTKIVKHQTADGGFAGNSGWAPTLSVGIANKSVTRAKERGAVVDEVVLKRALAQSQAAASGTAPAPVSEVAKGTTGAAAKPGSSIGGPVAMEGAPAMAGRMAGAAGDAGVMLYRVGQGAGNTQDVVNSLRVDAEKAKKVLADSNATTGEKDKAQKQLAEFKQADVANDRVQEQLSASVRDNRFVAGFGNNGGEEFLSFMNISEAMVLKGGKDWAEWDAKMVQGLQKAQDQNGSWSGQHCITGKTFCTAAALLVLMADRTQYPLEVIKAAREKKDAVAKPANETPKTPAEAKPEK